MNIGGATKKDGIVIDLFNRKCFVGGKRQCDSQVCTKPWEHWFVWAGEPPRPQHGGGKHDRAAQHVQADLGGRRGPVQKSPEQIRTGQNSSKQLRTQFRTVLTVQNSPNNLNSSDQS